MTHKEITPADVQTPFILYGGDDDKVHVKVFLKNETIWLPQRAIAELFGTSPDNIGLHLKNIFADEELDEAATAEDFSVVQNEGGRSVRRTLKFYNLDAIIAVGYWVAEYKEFNKPQPIESDFDKTLKEIKKLEEKKSAAGTASKKKKGEER